MSYLSPNADGSEPTEPDKSIEQQRFDLEKKVAEHEMSLAAQRFKIEAGTARGFGAIIRRNALVAMTAAGTFLAVVISGAQVLVTDTRAKAEQETQKRTADANREAQQEQQRLEWGLKVAEFLANNQKLLNSPDPQDAATLVEMILIAFPPEISQPLLLKLRTQERKRETSKPPAGTTKPPAGSNVSTRKATLDSAVIQATSEMARPLLAGRFSSLVARDFLSVAQRVVQAVRQDRASVPCPSFADVERETEGLVQESLPPGMSESDLSRTVIGQAGLGFRNQAEKVAVAVRACWPQLSSSR